VVKELFRIRVPASSAHLGPGYAVLAVALARYAEVTVWEGQIDGHVVEIQGRGEEPQLDPRHDPVLRSLHAAAEHWKIKIPAALRMVAQVDIPAASGLGTAAAAFAAGIALCQRFGKRAFPPDEALDLATSLGADPAHAAASLVGGLTSACLVSAPEDTPRYRLLTHGLHPSWRFVLALPNVRVGAADARRILPATLPHAATPRTSARLLGLLRALADADEELLGLCLRDEVHVPFRRRLVPGMEAAMQAAVTAKAAGATITGHGPGIVALTTDHKLADAIGKAMVNEFTKVGVAASALALEASAHGAL